MLGAKRLESRSCWEYAQINQLSFSVIDDLNKGTSLQRLKDLAPQVLVVCACKNILKKSVLEIQGLQAVNLHPSLLPNYRGPTPTFWMRYNSEPETGMTFHLMTPQIDVGPILLQYKVPLDRMRSEESTETELFTEAARHVEDVVMQVVRGEFPEQSQVGNGSYYSFPTSDDRRELSLRLSLRFGNPGGRSLYGGNRSER
jgi:methionyl-tRNA formyltransferase